MDKNDIGCDVSKAKGLTTKLVYCDDTGYIKITRGGVIGFGSGKWPGYDDSDESHDNVSLG